MHPDIRTIINNPDSTVNEVRLAKLVHKLMERIAGLERHTGVWDGAEFEFQPD